MGVKRNTYGPKLKRYKEENNLSYRAISEATGINPAMLWGWANGKVNPNANSEKKIAEFIKKGRYQTSLPLEVDKESELMLDSRIVAEMAEKRHKELLRDIRKYMNVISTSAKLRPLDFFVESSYKDTKGEERPCYLVTKKGCEMVANKMTGEKGILFTANYITRFHEMEYRLEHPYQPKVTGNADLQYIDSQLKQALDQKELGAKLQVLEKLQKFIEII